MSKDVLSLSLLTARWCTNFIALYSQIPSHKPEETEAYLEKIFNLSRRLEHLLNDLQCYLRLLEEGTQTQIIDSLDKSIEKLKETESSLLETMDHNLDDFEMSDEITCLRLPWFDFYIALRELLHICYAFSSTDNEIVFDIHIDDHEVKDRLYIDANVYLDLDSIKDIREPFYSWAGMRYLSVDSIGSGLEVQIIDAFCSRYGGSFDFPHIGKAETRLSIILPIADEWLHSG